MRLSFVQHGGIVHLSRKFLCDRASVDLPPKLDEPTTFPNAGGREKKAIETACR